MTDNSRKAKLGIGSQTESQKARSILSANGISSKVVKIESRLKDGGCLYGLEISQERLSDAVRTLRDAGIYSSILK